MLDLIKVAISVTPSQGSTHCCPQAVTLTRGRQQYETARESGAVDIT